MRPVLPLHHINALVVVVVVVVVVGVVDGAVEEIQEEVQVVDMEEVVVDMGEDQVVVGISVPVLEPWGTHQYVGEMGGPTDTPAPAHVVDQQSSVRELVLVIQVEEDQEEDMGQDQDQDLTTVGPLGVEHHLVGTDQDQEDVDHLAVELLVHVDHWPRFWEHVAGLDQDQGLGSKVIAGEETRAIAEGNRLEFFYLLDK